MRCEEVMELIQRNLDDDLSSSESANMHEHLQSCQECQSLYDGLSQLSLELENLPDIEPPISIVDRILPQLEESIQASPNGVAMHQPKTLRSPFLWKKWALAAGSAAAVVAIWISADHLLTPQSDQSNVQMESAADNTSNYASETDPQPEESASSELAMNRSLDVLPEQQPEQATEKAMLDAVAKQPAPKEKPSSTPLEREVKKNQEDHTVALQPSPDDLNRKTEADSSKPQATDQQAGQEMALTPQEKEELVEEMPSIAAIQAPDEEGTTTPPTALAPQESTEMIQTFKAPALSDTKEAASRGEAVYPSPNGEWMAQVDGQTVAIMDQSGMEIFRSHTWPAEMEVKVEWLDEHLLQYTLSSATREENGTSSEAETWRINIKDRQEQKQ